MNLSKKEIEIILKLRDEASKKVNSFRNNIKELNSGVKDQLQPLLLMRQAWLKTSLAIGFVVSAGAAGLKQLSGLRKEIEDMDISAIKLGVSTGDLSKKMHGFNIATTNARIASQGTGFFEDISNRYKEFKASVNEMEGGISRFEAARKILISRVQQGGWGSFFGNIAKTGWSSAWQGAWQKGTDQLLAEGESQRQKSKAALSANIDLTQKIKQLSLSALDYKKDLLNQEVRIFEITGADKIKLTEYQQATIKRLEEDRTLALKSMQAERLKIEGRTLDAIRLEQERALVEFKRQFGGDGEMVQEFIAGRQAIYREAKLNYWGLKNENQIWHDGMVSTIGSLQSTFAGFYDVTTGEFKSLGDMATDFGRTIIGVINQMIAQFIVAKAVVGISSLFSGAISGGVGGVNTGVQSAGGGLGASFPTWSPYPMAEGGEGIVRKPTLFLAGEAGAERYKFTPVNKMAGSDKNGGGGNNYYVTYNIAAMDAASFEEYCRRHPQGIIDISRGAAWDDKRRETTLYRYKKG